MPERVAGLRTDTLVEGHQRDTSRTPVLSVSHCSTLPMNHTTLSAIISLVTSCMVSLYLPNAILGCKSRQKLASSARRSSWFARRRLQ